MKAGTAPTHTHTPSVPEINKPCGNSHETSEYRTEPAAALNQTPCRGCKYSRIPSCWKLKTAGILQGREMPRMQTAYLLDVTLRRDLKLKEMTRNRITGNCMDCTLPTALNRITLPRLLTACSFPFPFPSTSQGKWLWTTIQ